jgi:hypothetical protein
MRQEITQRVDGGMPAHNALSRLDYISVFRIEKIVRKGRGKDRLKGYWYAAWVKSGKSRNVYLGNCDKISMEEALDKAKRIKAADLKLEEVTA